MIFPNIAASLSRIFYGWRMIGLVSAIRVVGGGIHQYGFTVFFLPISQDLGMSRAATSLAFSLARAQGAIEAPLVGYLIDRFGPRPIIVTAAFLAGAGYILLSWVDSYASFLVVYLAVISLAFIAGFVHSLDGHRQQLVYPSTSARHDRRQRRSAGRRRDPFGPCSLWESNRSAGAGRRFSPAVCFSQFACI